MRRVAILLVIAVILIGSGYLSIQLSQHSANGALPGMIVQTNDPSGSVLIATPSKGLLFLGVVVVIFVLLGGLTTGLALIFWYLNRQVVIAKTLPNQGFSLAPDTANPNGLMVILAKHRAITIVVVLVLVLGAALTAAVLGLFSAH